MQKDLPTGFAVGIGLMLILPLLNYLREAPIGDFYGEWLSAVSFSLATLFLVRRLAARTNASLTLLLVAAVAVGVLVIQAATGRLVYAYDWITWSAYLTLLVLAFLVGQALRGEGLAAAATSRLASALVLAGLINFIIQLLQVAGLDKDLAPFVVPLATKACRAYGNVGQANHATLLAWMAAMGALYLYGVGKTRLDVTSVIVASMLFSSALTVSRMAWIFLALGIAAVWHLRAWPAPSPRSRRLTAALLLGGFLVASLASSFVLGALREDCSSEFGRLTNAADGGIGIRIALWEQAINVWKLRPWLGAGAGLFMATAYRVQPLGQHEPIDYYAHNVLLQILAEFGVFMVLAIVAVLVWWLICLFRGRDALDAPDGVLLYWIGVLGVHSMLEFPLYYVHFLVLFGLGWGLVVRPDATAPAARLPLRATVGVLAVAVAAGCALAVVDYRRLERVNHLVTVLMVNNLGMTPEVADVLRHAGDEVVIYEPMADHALQLLTPLTADNIDEKIRATDRLVGKSPIAQVVMRRLALAVLAGDDETARWHAERLVTFYPRSAPDLFADLQKHFERDPVVQERMRTLSQRALATTPQLRW